jgi:hypothetical protein
MGMEPIAAGQWHEIIFIVIIIVAVERERRVVGGGASRGRHGPLAALLLRQGGDALAVLGAHGFGQRYLLDVRIGITPPSRGQSLIEEQVRGHPRQ